MAIKKSQFKALIKECLKEILAEGLGTTQLVESKSSRAQMVNENHPVRQSRPKQQYHPGLDEPRQASTYSQPQHNHAKSLVENSISKLTNDPAMGSIFADTAANTYAKQPQQAMGGSTVQKSAPATDIPLDTLAGALGGMNPSSWEALAFTDSKKLK